MAFSKYDPHAPPVKEKQGSTPAANRRAKLLKYGWWITMVYTAIGFAFMALFWLGVFP